MLRIRKGFQGQRLAVYPFYTVGDRLRSGLLIHSMGFFPNAAHHYIDRPEGCGEYILVWCLDGEGWLIIDGIKQVIPKFHYFILPPDKGHAYGSSNNQPWSIYWAHFTGDISQICSFVCKVCCFPENGNVQEVRSLFDDMLTLMEGHADENVSSFLDLAFPRLLSAFLYPSIWNRCIPDKNVPNLSIVGKASHYMEEHVSEKLTLTDICSYLGYSESYVARVFSTEVGCGPMTYLQRLKASRACRLLENTNLKINQIALMLGFDDPFYFSKFFTKAHGVSPKEYRKIHQA